MTCEQATILIDDEADAPLAADDQAALFAHLEGCAACREERRAVRTLLQDAAALPEEVEPSRDLWEGIAPRLATRRALSPRRVAVLAAPWLAAAAVTVFAVSALTRTPVPAPAPASTPAAVQTPVAQPASQLAGEAEYVRATEELMTALAGARTKMTPETQAVVDRNLRVIDEALAEIRGALAQDPDDAELVQLLSSTHRAKVGMLQKAILL